MEALRAGRSGTRRRRAVLPFSNRRHALRFEKITEKARGFQSETPRRCLRVVRRVAGNERKRARLARQPRVSQNRSRASEETKRRFGTTNAFHMKSHTSIVPDCSERRHPLRKGFALFTGISARLSAGIAAARGDAAGDGPPRGAGARGGDAGADLASTRGGGAPRGGVGGVVDFTGDPVTETPPCLEASAFGTRSETDLENTDVPDVESICSMASICCLSPSSSVRTASPRAATSVRTSPTSRSSASRRASVSVFSSRFFVESSSPPRVARGVRACPSEPNLEV